MRSKDIEQLFLDRIFSVCYQHGFLVTHRRNARKCLNCLDSFGGKLVMIVIRAFLSFYEMSKRTVPESCLLLSPKTIAGYSSFTAF